MKRYQPICVGIFLVLALGMGWAQEGDNQSSSAGSQAPAAAVGPTTTAPDDNPPISSLDSPSLEPLSTARSFLQPGLHLSQSVDSNVSNATGNSGVSSVTRALGSLELQRLWENYQTSLDYIGGGAFYSSRSANATQLHQLEFDQRVLWRTGQLALRDSFSYFPEGSFGYGAYGGAGTIGGLGGIGGGGGLAGGGLGGSTFFGSGQFASIGQTPRISNTALAQVTESLNPRSSITMTGSYGLVHYLDNTFGFINSRQFAGQFGYNYQLNRSDQVALVYGFQAFRYPSTTASDFKSHIINVLYGHRISGRMDVVLGGGPQITLIDNPGTGSSSRVSMSGRAALHYRFPKTSLALSYDHFNTSGSGFFAGATSDVSRLSINHPISRQWNLNADVGFTHNTRIQNVTVVNSRTFDYLYMGGGLRRQLGRNFSAYVSYQFNYLFLDSSVCGSSTSCSSNSQRHVGLIGLDWRPHPIRLD